MDKSMVAKAMADFALFTCFAVHLPLVDFSYPNNKRHLYKMQCTTILITTRETAGHGSGKHGVKSNPSLYFLKSMY